MDRICRAIKDGEERMRENKVSTMMPKFTNRTDGGHYLLISVYWKKTWL